MQRATESMRVENVAVGFAKNRRERDTCPYYKPNRIFASYTYGHSNAHSRRETKESVLSVLYAESWLAHTVRVRHGPTRSNRPNEHIGPRTIEEGPLPFFNRPGPNLFSPPPLD